MSIGSEESLNYLTPRQIYAVESTSYEELPKDIDINQTGGYWSVDVRGVSMTPPEVDKLTQVLLPDEPVFQRLLGEQVLYFDIKNFNLKYGEQGVNRFLDLNELIPPGWKFKIVNFTTGSKEPPIRPPENLKALSLYAISDPEAKEVVTGYFDDNLRTSEDVGKSVLWQVLVARFQTEVGEPWTDESRANMVKIIEKRREEVINALTGDTDDDPKEVATRSFLVPQDPEDRF